MKTVFSGGSLQKKFIRLLNPTAISVLNSLAPDVSPTHENVQWPNSHAIIDLRDDFFRHFNCPSRERPIRSVLDYVVAKANHMVFHKTLKHWLQNPMRAVIDYAIGKLDHDIFYEGLVNWLLRRLSMMDWQFPSEHASGPPVPALWNYIPPKTKERLVAHIEDDYKLLLQRTVSIHSKLGNSKEGLIQKRSRHQQFVNRMLAAFEREVIVWK